MIAVDRLEGDGGAKFLGDREGALTIDMRQHDGEFLAADPAEEITGTKGRLADRSHRLENRVSRGMSIPVVHLLEMVDIENDTGQLMLVPQSERNQLVGLLFEGAPGHRLGQAIGGSRLHEIDAVHRRRCQFLKNAKISAAERSWPAVDRAYRADHMPGLGSKRHAGIKADMVLAGYRRMPRKSRILGGILHDDGLVAVDHATAEGVFQRHFVGREPGTGLVPLPVPVDQRYDADVDGKDLLDQADDPLEAFVSRRVEEIELLQRSQTVVFAPDRLRRRLSEHSCNHHAACLLTALT
ncbi:sensory box/GGDEF family protein [Rhizobium leguminosarum bv. phaseoli CCGM1]|nr:sensory box/GGDEF family protein [Rhizobium leguminosarum bv. phaseoli CCGM1]